jgi:beta-1,4-glucosyltransferase
VKKIGNNAAARRFAKRILADLGAGRCVTVTWLNHFSAMEVGAMEAGPALESMSYIGIDGQFLRLLGRLPVPRTSADLVVPMLVDALGAAARVALVGGEPSSLDLRVSAFKERFPSAVIEMAVDGFTISNHAELAESVVRGTEPNVVLIGMGGGRQEMVARAISSLSGEPRVILTVGGFLDQLTMPGYYPWWAYPTGLTWLVRLAREPRRLWRRYTSNAIEAWRMRYELRSLRGLEGVRRVAAVLEER